MTRPLLLDLFSGAGGCSVGYHRAGFDVVGVDIEPHKDYPYDFRLGDAMDVLNDATYLAQFDAIHASPPCQAYSVTRHTHSVEHPDLYRPVKMALEAWSLRHFGRPWVIENVPGVPMPSYVTLCGSMFDLRATDEDGTELALRRHRLFESNVMLLAPGPCRHDDTQVGGVYGGGSSDRRHAKEVRRGGYTPKVHVRRDLMGIDWMNGDDLSQAIPPAYTEHLGQQLLDHVQSAAA